MATTHGDILLTKSRRFLFLFFFGSGFCGLIYQTVWVRLAYFHFGVTTPVLSVVLSVFMLGLALGSKAVGAGIAPLARKTRSSSLLYYGLCEILIGLGGLLVPVLFPSAAACFCHWARPTRPHTFSFPGA